MAHDRVREPGPMDRSRRWRSGQASRHDRGRSELARPLPTSPHRRSSLALRARSAPPTGPLLLIFLGRARALVASPSASSCAASRLHLLRRRKEARGIGLEGGDAEAESGASDGVAAGDGDGPASASRRVMSSSLRRMATRRVSLLVIGRHRPSPEEGRGGLRRRGALAEGRRR